MNSPFPAMSRRVLLAGAALAATLAFPPPPALAQAAGHWTGTWGAGPAGPPLPAGTKTFSNQTLRMIVHTSIGGKHVRIRLSNEMGSTPLRIGAAHLAQRAKDADIVPGTDRALTFGGAASITIPPGAPALSDPVELDVAALSDLAVSVYLPETAGATTIHGTASQTNYVSQAGNFAGAATLPVQHNIGSWPFLTEVDVEGGDAAIVTLGDSITDGTRSTPDAVNRWPDWLARRLQGRLGVVNRGISGNRLVSNPPEGSLAGRNALERFERDVLATAGVRYMTLMVGINDIGNSPDEAPISANELIAGYRQLIARAHGKGIAIVAATLTPFEDAKYYSATKETVRQAVNEWIRKGGEFDGVIDFDLVTRDPAHPARLLAAYDSGDHLHPNDRGYEAMGKAVPLELFRQAPQALR